MGMPENTAHLLLMPHEQAKQAGEAGERPAAVVRAF